MDSTINYAVIAIAAVIGLVVFLFIAKRVVRLAVRLMLVGLLVVALASAGGWAWWNGWFGSQPTPRTEHSVPPRRTTSR
jgi:Na+/proline symporter